jgi:macrolide transport system ATP-binding/permease protein
MFDAQWLNVGLASNSVTPGEKELKTNPEVGPWPVLERVSTDVRFAFRQLCKSPGSTIITILMLSLGIAAAVAIFGFVDAALIRPLPYPDLSRLMGVFKTTQLGSQYAGYSYPDYVDLVRSNRVFASIAAYDSDGGFILSDAGGAHLVDGTGVTDGFFRILGVTPILGRDFDPNPASEDLRAAPATVVLSYAAWQKWFGGSSDVLGKTVTLSGESYSVIGVLPRSFQFAPAGAAGFWTTLHPYAGNACYLSRGCMVMGVIAQLHDGVTINQALADVRAIAAHEAREYPDPDKNRGANIAPLSRWILGDVKPILLALLGGAGLLLLIAYVNVAGLLLARSENRRREFAVRGVLGASRGRLTQQFMTEGFVIVAISGALGLLVATVTRELLLTLIPADMLDFVPYLDGGWNWHLAAFAAALVIIALILFALTPALQLPFANLRASLAAGGRGAARTSLRHFGAKLVILEVVATMVLLAGAGLLGKSLYLLLDVDMGFVPGHLATLSMLAPEAKYSRDPQALALQREVVIRLQSLPGVTAVATARTLPVTGVPSTQIGFVGRPTLGVNNEVGHQVIGTGYLSAVLKARLFKGRYFNENDDASAPLVAIINETLARRYFPGENPIGKEIFYHAHDIKLEALQPPIQIVGVIADVRDYALDEAREPVVYTPFDQGPERSFFIAARTSQDAASVLPLLIATIREIDPDILTSDAATMPEIIQNSPAAYWHRVSASLVGGFSAAALLLSMIGLYGVVAYSVSQRTREIGVRMAVGATRASVYQFILAEAGWLTLVGLAIGAVGSIAAGTFMRNLLFGVRPWDVSILSAVAAVLTISALLATFVPARRAASVDPVDALRSE